MFLRFSQQQQVFRDNSCVSHPIQFKCCVLYAICELNMNGMLSVFTKRHDHNAYKMKNNELVHERSVEQN